jgi:four helix bundle protein
MGQVIVSNNIKPKDITQRTFKFAVAIVKFCRTFERQSTTFNILGRQLLRAGTSIGANMEEAQAGQSRADFICKCSIALKETRETLYWLRLLQHSDGIQSIQQKDRLSDAKHSVPEIETLIGEAKELSNILAAILIKSKARTAAK